MVITLTPRLEVLKYNDYAVTKRQQMQSGQILTTWKILKIPHPINMTYHFHFLSSIIRITAKKSIPILGLTYIPMYIANEDLF